MTSFWCGEGFGGGIVASACRESAERPALRPIAAGVKISPEGSPAPPLRVRAAAADCLRLRFQALRASRSRSAVRRWTAPQWPGRGSLPRRLRLRCRALPPGPRRPRRPVRERGREDRRNLAPALESFQFAQPAFEPFAAATQRLVDGFGRGGEPPLQDGQCEANRAGPLIVFQCLGAVEFLAHIVGDHLVEMRLGVGKFVGHRVGDALREKRRAVELEQVLLHHPTHQVGDVGRVDAVAEAALETVAIEQRHEELEVLLLAVVRRRRHQQEMPRERREQLPEPVALGVLDLAAEKRWPTSCGLRRRPRGPSGSRAPGASAARPRCGRACRAGR